MASLRFAFSKAVRSSAKMKRRFVILGLMILAITLLQVLFSELSESQRKRTDVYMYEQLTNQIVNKLSTSEFPAASGVHTVCLFPKNPLRLFRTGNNSVLLVGGKNKGELPLKIIGFRADIYHTNDYHRAVQSLRFNGLGAYWDFRFGKTDSFQFKGYANSVVPASVTANWEYIFTVDKNVKGGTYDLVGIISYSIGEETFQNTFYNGTIEIVEPNDPIRVDDVILSGAVVMFCIIIGVCPRIHIKNDITKEVKRVHEFAYIRDASKQSTSYPIKEK